MINSLVLKANASPKRHKKERYSIGNVSIKYLSKIIREFERLPYTSYEMRRPKHDPTDTYFYLSRHLAECMMRDYALNLHFYPVKTDITGT